MAAVSPACTVFTLTCARWMETTVTGAKPPAGVGPSISAWPTATHPACVGHVCDQVNASSWTDKRHLYYGFTNMLSFETVHRICTKQRRIWLSKVA